MDVANAIAVDSSGAAYVAGYTYSTDLPVVECDARGPTPEIATHFLARVSATGTLSYLTYLGGNGSDTATAVALASGNVYLAGWTLSTNFPLRNPYQSVDIDNYGAFLMEVDSGSPPVNQGVTPNPAAAPRRRSLFSSPTPAGLRTCQPCRYYSIPRLPSQMRVRWSTIGPRMPCPC